MNPGRGLGLPSFTGLSPPTNDSREYDNNKGMNRSGPTSGGGRGRSRQTEISSETPLPADRFERSKSSVSQGNKAGFSHGSSSSLLLQDTLTPLLDEVDALFEESKRIVASMKAQGSRLQDEDTEVEIMERMAEAWQTIEAKNARHDTAQKLNREKPMFCMDSLGKRIKAALLCKALPKGDNPAEYVNGPDNAPSRNLVTAMKLSGYVIHSGTGGKVSAVDGDGRKPPSNYTKEEFHNNVLPRVAENQPPRILNELRQLSCRLVASGIAKGLLTEDDLPQIRRILISRFQDGGLHFLSGGDAAFARFIGVAANAHRLLERGDIDEFVLFHERVVKLVGMCRNRVRRAAYATSKNMLAQTDGTGRYVVVKSGRRPAQQHQQQQQQQQHHQAATGVIAAAPSGVKMAVPAPSQSIQGQTWRNGESPVTPASARGSGISGQPPYEAPGAVYGKPTLDNSFNGNGNSIVRAAMSMLPVENMTAQATNHRAQMGLAPTSESTNVGAGQFHDPNGTHTPAAQELFSPHTQMGYRRAPAYGHEGTWGNGAMRGQTGHVSRVDAPPVLVLQPGWGVTLPPYFLGMTDPKRPRNVPVKMLWELRAEPLSGSPDLVMVEMRQVPGYLDFLAEIMPPDLLKFRWGARCWDTLQGKHDGRSLLEEAAGALHHLGLVPMPPDSPVRLVYDEIVSHSRNGDSTTQYAVNLVNLGASPSPGTAEGSHGHTVGHSNKSNHPIHAGVPPVAAGVLRDLHREGADTVMSNSWRDGGIVGSVELQRPLNTTASLLGTGPPSSTFSTTSSDGLGGCSSGGVGPGTSIPPSTGRPLSGQWVPPPVSSVAETNANTAVGHGVSCSPTSTLASKGPDNTDGCHSGNVNGSSSSVGVKRKAGPVLTDTALTEDDVDW